MSDPPRPKVIPFRTAAPDKDLVAMLERLLAQAKAGHIDAIACVYLDEKRARSLTWGGEGETSDFVSMAHELAMTLTLASLAEYGKSGDGE